MYYELYIDVLFFRNLLLDYLLLSLIAKLLKLPAGKSRRLLAASLGSAGICLLYAFSLERSWLGYLIIYVVLSTGMVKIGLGIRNFFLLGRAVALLFICSALLGGLFQWVQGRFLFPVYPFLGITLVSFWLLSAGMRFLFRFQSREENLVEVTLGFHGRKIQVRALRDTGNQLRDPVFGKPVSIITEELQKTLCQKEEVLFYPVPFHSIGKQGGMLQAFFADYLCIQTPEGRAEIIERPMLGITKEPLSSKDEYDMILHPDLLS